jgi:Dienelactone hydrolase family
VPDFVSAGRYQEPPEVGRPYRAAFLGQVEALLDGEYERAAARRAELFQPDFASLESYKASVQPYRQRLRAMLGWPLILAASEGVPTAREMLAGQDDLGCIYRLWIEVMPNLEAYGLLFLPPVDRPCALVLSQHGGLGTPELCSGFFGSANYNDMTRRVLRRGVAVFAPQLFRWDEQYGPRHDPPEIDRRFKQLGGSLAALEIWCLQRSLDYLLNRKDIDSRRVGMIGLSYGGFHTLFMAALDVRVRVALSSCFVNDRRRYGWGDLSWFNAANTSFDAQVAGLICPRALCVEVGQNDELFDVQHARPEASQIQVLYERLGIPGRFRYHEHPGGHELDLDDGGIEFLCHHLTADSQPQ